MEVDFNGAIVDVRLWHKADMQIAVQNVSFWGKSGRVARHVLRVRA